MKSQLLILGLHRVGCPPPSAKIRGLFVSPRLLSFQLSLVQKMGYKFSTLKNALAEPEGRHAVITFDDGYADNFTNALPVLQRFDAPATIFVITEDVGRRNVVWNEAGEDLPADLLDWERLEILRRRGWEIGSHAHRHIHLARYDEAAQQAVIEKSINEIKRNLGITPVSFAYPYGSYNKTTTGVLRRLGIKYAVTTHPARREEYFENRDLLELSRVSIGGRKPHHYFKSIARTAKAVGSAAVFNALTMPVPIGLPLRSAKDNIMP